jgi:hypothetical protein
MSIQVSLDELYSLEKWANSNVRAAPEFEIALRASSTLRGLMSQDLSKKDLLTYLHQQMGILPKSERGQALLSKQFGGSAIPRAIFRQP